MDDGLAHVQTTVAGVRWAARVALDDAPAGRTPAILVHGLGISSSYMAPLARELAPHVPVYAPDLPGFGLSGKPRDGRTLDIPQLAAHLRAWMDAMGIARASLVANSLGSVVVAELAARYPARVERLALLGPSRGRTGELMRQAGALVVDAVRERPSLLLLHARDDFRAGVPRLWRTVRASTRHPLSRSLPHVEAPVLVVRGARDPLVTARDARAVALMARHGRVVTVPGAPHASNYSAAPAVARAIVPFLLEEAEKSQSTAMLP